MRLSTCKKEKVPVSLYIAIHLDTGLIQLTPAWPWLHHNSNFAHIQKLTTHLFSKLSIHHLNKQVSITYRKLFIGVCNQPDPTFINRHIDPLHKWRQTNPSVIFLSSILKRFIYTQGIHHLLL